MIFDDRAKELAKLAFADYLDAKGIDTTGKPFLCINPMHREKTGSMHYHEQRNKLHCFGCGADYDIFDFVAIEYGLPLGSSEAFKKTYELVKILNKSQPLGETNRGHRL